MVASSTAAAAYSASKAALLSLGKSVVLEYAALSLRVVTVSPGLTATLIWLGDEGAAVQIASLTGGSPDDIADEVVASIPIMRFLRPEETGATICILASTRASGITGTEVVVDGGLIPTI